METYIIADTHFDHPDILFHANRPWLKDGDRVNGRWVDKDIAAKRTEEMNNDMVERWNRVVTKRDRVIIIGDFAFKRHGRWVNVLNGKKIMISGNHDDMADLFKKQFTEYHEFGVDKIVNRQLITFCHYPMYTWDRKSEGAWCLFGHVHGRMPQGLPGPKNISGGLMLDMGADVWDYTPVHFDRVEKVMQEKRQALEEKGKTFKDPSCKRKGKTK